MVPGRNLALIGFMSAGKSLVGRALAQMTGFPFFDVDGLIESLEHVPIHRIFQTRGEPYFRRVEAAVLRQVCQGSGQIIACGGGTVLLEENRALLRDTCLTVWLMVSADEVLARLQDAGNPRRPLLEGRDPREVVEELMRLREPLYQEADLAVLAEGRPAEEIAREIAVRAGLPVVGT